MDGSNAFPTSEMELLYHLDITTTSGKTLIQPVCLYEYPQSITCAKGNNVHQTGNQTFRREQFNALRHFL